LDATSSSIPARHLLILTFFLSLLLFIHDTHARGTPEQTAESPFSSMEPMRFEDFLSRGSPVTDMSSPDLDNLALPMKSIDLGLPLGETGFYGLPPDSTWTTHRITSKPPRESLLSKAILSGAAVYRSAREDSDARVTLDFVLPARFDTSSFFLESRADFRNPCSRSLHSGYRGFDLGFGLGWRKVWEEGLMLGTNAFWDASRLSGDWYSAPGFGFEFAKHSQHGIWDIILNVYRGGGIDLEGGFTFPIWDERLDLRVYAGKYRFFEGDFILGSKGGVQISSPNRFLAVSYEYGQDSTTPEYHALTCSLTVPFSLEKLFSGKNPFELPDAPSTGKRYVERLKSEGVKRAWRKPETVVEARNTPQGERWTTPGRLTDSILWSKKPATEPEKTANAESKMCYQRDCCRCSCSRCNCYDKKSDDESSEKGLWNTIGLLVLTYVGGDYLYRNAFGPFELEPHEIERIKQEMPNRPRRK
jgi:hypothetical protein